jgi:4-hydroxy-3-polyprenylbenzoate decarboxylase
MNFPEIVDIALPAEGVFHNLVFVSIKKTYPMQAYKIMHGLWGMGQMMLTKYIVVVGDDVNVHNASEVLFRLCANTDPQRDSIFTKGPADVLDHATSEIASGSKLDIGATTKLPQRPRPQFSSRPVQSLLANRLMHSAKSSANGSKQLDS